MHFSLSVKRAITAAVAPLFIFAAVFAAPVKAEEAAQPALWKLTDHDSEVWLFGTIHLLDPKLKWQSAKVDTAFNAATQVYFEADTSPAQIQSIQQAVAQYAYNANGVKLSTLLSAEGNQNLKDTLVHLGVPAAATANFEPLRPWFVSLNLAQIQFQKQGLDPNAGVEKILEAKAKKAGKSLAYLETAASQIVAFGSLSTEAELAYLEEGLLHFDEAEETLQKLIHSWKTGDVAEIEKVIHQGFVEGEMYDALLTNRNKNWAAQIKEIMDGSGKVFIAVGAAHLVGKSSVQELLKGYQLKAVRQ